MKKTLVILIILGLFILTGCTTQSTKSLCKSPYIEFKIGECCLDIDNNSICDNDEKVKEKTENTEEIIVEEEPVVIEPVKETIKQISLNELQELTTKIYKSNFDFEINSTESTEQFNAYYSDSSGTVVIYELKNKKDYINNYNDFLTLVNPLVNERKENFLISLDENVGFTNANINPALFKTDKLYHEYIANNVFYEFFYESNDIKTDFGIIKDEFFNAYIKSSGEYYKGAYLTYLITFPCSEKLIVDLDSTNVAIVGELIQKGVTVDVARKNNKAENDRNKNALILKANEILKHCPLSQKILQENVKLRSTSNEYVSDSSLLEYLREKILYSAEYFGDLKDEEIDNNEVYFKVNNVNYEYNGKLKSITIKLINKLDETKKFKIKIRSLDQGTFRVIHSLDTGDVGAGETLIKELVLEDTVYLERKDYLLNFFLDKDDEGVPPLKREIGEISYFVFFSLSQEQIDKMQ